MSATVPIDTVADGNLLYSSEDISMTIGSATVIYFSRDIRLTKAAQKVEGKNSAGKVFRKGYIKRGYYQGSATLMYPSTGTPTVPPELTLFTVLIPELGATALNCIVTSVAPARGNDSEATCSIEFDEVINPPATVGA